MWQWKKALATGSGYGEYCKELYDEGNILFYKSAIDIFVDKEAVKIGEVMRSMLKSDPPFLIHCQHGRDRTGLVGIILQTLAGATYEEVESSYMKAFYNWHRLDASNPNGALITYVWTDFCSENCESNSMTWELKLFISTLQKKRL